MDHIMDAVSGMEVVTIIKNDRFQRFEVKEDKPEESILKRTWSLPDVSNDGTGNVPSKEELRAFPVLLNERMQSRKDKRPASYEEVQPSSDEEASAPSVPSTADEGCADPSCECCDGDPDTSLRHISGVSCGALSDSDISDLEPVELPVNWTDIDGAGDSSLEENSNTGSPQAPNVAANPPRKRGKDRKNGLNLCGSFAGGCGDSAGGPDAAAGQRKSCQKCCRASIEREPENDRAQKTPCDDADKAAGADDDSLPQIDTIELWPDYVLQPKTAAQQECIDLQRFDESPEYWPQPRSTSGGLPSQEAQPWLAQVESNQNASHSSPPAPLGLHGPPPAQPPGVHWPPRSALRQEDLTSCFNAPREERSAAGSGTMATTWPPLSSWQQYHYRQLLVAGVAQAVAISVAQAMDRDLNTDVEESFPMYLRDPPKSNFHAMMFQYRLENGELAHAVIVKKYCSKKGKNDIKAGTVGQPEELLKTIGEEGHLTEIREDESPQLRSLALHALIAERTKNKQSVPVRFQWRAFWYSCPNLGKQHCGFGGCAMRKCPGKDNNDSPCNFCHAAVCKLLLPKKGNQGN